MFRVEIGAKIHVVLWWKSCRTEWSMDSGEIMQNVEEMCKYKKKSLEMTILTTVLFFVHSQL